MHQGGGHSGGEMGHEKECHLRFGREYEVEESDAKMKKTPKKKEGEDCGWYEASNDVLGV